jgi:hypothetical protein
MIVKIDFRMCLITNTYSFFNEISKKSQLKIGGFGGISPITGFLDIIGTSTHFMMRGRI